MSNASIQTRVLGVLRNYSVGASVRFIAETLELKPEVVTSVLESLYVSSMVERRRLSNTSIDIYRLVSN